jgi:hypothetical protein
MLLRTKGWRGGKMPLLPNYKEIVDLLKKGATIEAQEKIMELREGALALQEENLQLKARVTQLENEQNVGRNLSFDGAVYWLNSEHGAKEGPMCPRCHDVHRRLMRLHRSESFGGRRVWYCHECKIEFG